MTEPKTSFEMPLPKSRREVIGAFIMTGFILLFVLLALKNILSHVALIASSIWLLLVAAVIYGYCKENGCRQFFINVLGSFAVRQFVESAPKSNGLTEIRFGYQLLGRRFYYMIILADRIESVEWHSGQGTAMCGRDMDDWSIGLWYDHNDPIESQKRHWMPKPDKEVYIVGPSDPKEVTAALGREFLGFLQQAGVSLIQGQDEITFTRK